MQAAISVAVSIYSLIILGIILYCCMVENHDNNMRAKSMRILIILCMLGTTFDLIGYAMSPFLRENPIRWIINTGAIVIGLWFSVAFCFYVIGCIRMTHEISIIWESIAFVAGMLFTMVISAALPFKLVFYYEKGDFVEGPLYGVCLAFSVLIALYALGITIANSQKLGLHDTIALSLYIIFSVIAAIIEAMLPGISLIYTGMSISTLFLYLLIQEKAVHESKAEEEEAKSSAQKQSEFMALMSHEIRTPLHAIVGINEMIMRETNERRIYDLAQNMNRSGQTLVSVVDDILDSAVLRANKLSLTEDAYETCKLGEAFRDFTRIIGQKNGVEYIYQVDEDLPSILVGDLQRLEQIMHNLVSNAVKYTSEGHVKMSIGFEKIDQSSVNLKIAVEDTGIGIKPSNIPHILEIEDFLGDKETKYIEGTGLGILIAKSLLELMGSQLEISSVYGEGSTFSFTVKQTIADAVPIGKMGVRRILASSDEERPVLMAPNAQILLVDDYKLNNVVCEGLLRPSRVKCDSAESGEYALSLCAVKHYDLIFVDQLMPVMDGVECLQRIRRESLLNRDTPIIALTANVVSGNREELLDAGFSDYLARPIDPKELEQILLKFLPQEFIVWGSRTQVSPFESES